MILASIVLSVTAFPQVGQFVCSAWYVGGAEEVPFPILMLKALFELSRGLTTPSRDIVMGEGVRAVA